MPISLMPEMTTIPKTRAASVSIVKYPWINPVEKAWVSKGAIGCQGVPIGVIKPFATNITNTIKSTGVIIFPMRSTSLEGVIESHPVNKKKSIVNINKGMGLVRSCSLKKGLTPTS
ncbi:hypothetical protein SDC9_194317 [bioreactor metagenome]|uniref:Uncharacterized protein n=1 Tax=bioreactor metagenome TaxID=1076179 RepID=A0A645I6J4_9ZZZZ